MGRKASGQRGRRNYGEEERTLEESESAEA